MRVVVQVRVLHVGEQVEFDFIKIQRMGEDEIFVRLVPFHTSDGCFDIALSKYYKILLHLAPQ